MAKDIGSQATILHCAELPMESFSDPDYGNVRWQTLFTADRTETSGLTCGVAHLRPGDCLALHRHAHPETYFGLSGRARIMVDGVAHELTPGTAIFIPGGAIHGMFADTEDAQILYTFPANSFSEIEYQFLMDAAPKAPAVAAVQARQLDLMDALSEDYSADTTLQ
ncbi:cupin domain-containing protein [Fluviibacterium sp. S390]|uniref:cupin domain-containing protein n=1 Tax=Fluviibacterium sp. S390 TaxID=3415139 RepID=UPI003C7D64A8